MIVGLLGLIGSGKNTVANYLMDKKGFHKISFAHNLKNAVAEIFNWPRHLLEGDTEKSRAWRESEDPWWSARLGWTVTPRKALQLMGTEAGRDVFGENLWVSSAFSNIDPRNNYVITDCRFQNEIKATLDFGGKLFVVKRGDWPEWYETAKVYNEDPMYGDNIMEEFYPEVHISEWDWIGREGDAIVIKNDGTLEELYEKVNEVIR